MTSRKWCPLAVLLLCLLLPSLPCRAGEAEQQLLQQGNEAYSRGDYPQAIGHYQQLIATAGFSAPVLFNLANSYAQSGEIGRAVLNYERALRLAPGDSDIAGNLELVRKESGLFTGEPEGTARFFHLLHLNQWAMLGLVTVVLFALFQLAALRFPFAGKVSAGVAITCLLLFGLAVAGTLSRYRQFNPAVVLAPDARLLISPFSAAGSVGAIQEGRLVYPEKTHGEFTYVRDETNRKGWIPSAMVELVDGGRPPGRH
jgi:tetratricopeptide (TPR) repeat protein